MTLARTTRTPAGTPTDFSRRGRTVRGLSQLNIFPQALPLRPFQVRFLKRALRPEVRTVAWSMPRGNGKSTLAALLNGTQYSGYTVELIMQSGGNLTTSPLSPDNF